jgi:hypothetical protein
MSLARIKLGQLLSHMIHTWTHGLEYQVLRVAIGPVVFEFTEQSCDISGPFYWRHFDEMGVRFGARLSTPRFLTRDSSVQYIHCVLKEMSIDEL